MAKNKLCIKTNGKGRGSAMPMIVGVLYSILDSGNGIRCFALICNGVVNRSS